MLKGLLGLLSCLLVQAVVAQPFDDLYRPDAEPEEPRPMLAPDSALFYRAVQSASDLYATCAGFNLPQVSLRRRGQDFRAERSAVEGVELSYRYFAALRALGATEHLNAGLASTPLVAGGRGGVRELRLPEGMPQFPFSASVRLSDRQYRLGGQFSASGELGRGWRGAAAVELRTGRDLYVGGLFTNAVTVGFRLDKQFGSRHELALLVVAPTSVRGTRLSSTEEAFALTGDRLYNPAWGFQNGKVRNSRVRRETMPLAAVWWRSRLSEATTLTVALGAEGGLERYSMLGWYNARTPMPDNYRYLPSYAGDSDAEQVWRANDPRYTQIDWDELIAQNRLSGGHAVYALEDRTERRAKIQLRGLFTTRLDARLTLHYELFYCRDMTRSYKQMRDLLGADHVVDIDQFLIDDDTYGNLLQNDLRRPDRIIRRDDRFGYDYAISSRDVGVRLHAAYRADRFRADVVGVLRDAAILRRGYMEKELFPGEQSYGRSRRLHFTPYLLKALAGVAFSPRSYLEATLSVGAELPDPEALFYQPLYNNRTIERPTAERFYGAEINYRLSSADFDLQCGLFFTATFDRQQTNRYFDDLAGQFCNLSASGIGEAAYGVEAAAEFRLSYRWRVSAAASAGRYKYIRNPQITILSDVDNAAVETRAESFMGGCTLGGSPQLTASTGVSYFGPKGWGFRLSAGYAGLRYVTPVLLRRTERVARQGGLTREAFEAFTRQERLRDAFTVDASLFKTFYWGQSRLTASLLLRNLPGDRTTVSSGYESLRVRSIRSGDVTFRSPHPTRYTYAYPRSFYLSVTYKF